VEVVAIHRIGPDGLTFSPKPDKPLIGSNALQTVTTEWSNIDISSIKVIPELNTAYLQAEKGKTIPMSFGPHFHKISDSMERISHDLPRASYWVSGELRRIGLKELVKDHGQYRPNRWSIPSSERDKTLAVWTKELKDLEAIRYRADVISFRSKLDRAISSLKKISNEEQAFSISAARDIAELLSVE
jgi:hypothetical protein